MARQRGLDEPSTGQQLVTMANALTRAAHGLSVVEKRLICMALTKVDARNPVPSGQVLITRVKASDYAETFGVDIEVAYEQLQETAKVLYNRSITFYTPAAQRKGKPLPPTRHQMRWVGRASYQKGEGWVEVAWWPEVVPYLTGLSEQFTSYKLQQASTLRSTYTWRLLELLTQFEATGRLDITADDFAESMGATEAQRANFAKMRIQVIEQAIRELTDKDGWVIEWSTAKRGRRVHSLHFEFKRDEQLSLDLAPKPLAKAKPAPPNPEQQNIQAMLAALQSPEAQAMLAAFLTRTPEEREASNAEALANWKSGLDAQRTQEQQAEDEARREAETRAGAKSAHKNKAKRARIEGARQAAPETGEPSPTRTYDTSAADTTDRIPFDA